MLPFGRKILLVGLAAATLPAPAQTRPPRRDCLWSQRVRTPVRLPEPETEDSTAPLGGAALAVGALGILARLARLRRV